jgi:hypothetical protein
MEVDDVLDMSFLKSAACTGDDTARVRDINEKIKYFILLFCTIISKTVYTVYYFNSFSFF